MNPSDAPASFAQQFMDESGLLRSVMDAVPDSIFCKDRVGRYLTVNRAHATLFGLDTSAVLGQTVFDLPGLKEFAPLYHADDMAVMATGHPIVNREEPFGRADGRHGWFLTSKYPLRDADGEVIGLVGIARDISDAKRANDELTEARLRLIDHVENSPLAVIEWSPDFRVQRWTGQAEAIFGWRTEEVLNRHFGDWAFVHPADAAAVDEIARQLLEGRALRNVSHNRVLAKDGRTVHTVWHNSVLRNAQGRILSLLSLVEDVTERVAAEQAARDNQRLYRSLIEATGTGYVVLDTHGRVLEANAEYVRLTGRDSFDEIRGRPTRDWVAPDHHGRDARALVACSQSGFVRNLEMDYCSTDGERVPVEINARVIETAGNRQIIALCRDITARRAIENERQNLERKLQETQKLESLAALAGGIGHDFNNLLTGVLGNASVMAAELPPSSPVLEYIEQIEVAGSRAAELCTQMLAYAGQGRFTLRPLQLNKLLAESADPIRHAIGREPTLDFDLAQCLPNIRGDAAQLRQVILNLAINASEALGPKHGTIRITTGLKHATPMTFARAHLSPDLPEADYVCLEITDNGCGIAPELRSRIFDPFFTTKFTGRGLGLAAALGIIRGHQGAIEIDSQPGFGTTVRVLLPIDSSRAEPEFVAPVSEGPWRGRGTMLVIDDEVTIRRTLSQMLKALGFDVQVASDGMEGIDLFLANPDAFVAVLLDLTMPKLDGVAVFRSLRDLRPSARVLVMSGYDEAEVISRFGSEVPTGFVHKPFRLPDLREKLRSILD